MAVDNSAYEAAKNKKPKKAVEIQDDISDSMKFGDKTQVSIAIADRHGRQILDGYAARMKQIMPEIASFIGEINVAAKVLEPDIQKALPPSGSFITSLYGGNDE